MTVTCNGNLLSKIGVRVFAYSKSVHPACRTGLLPNQFDDLRRVATFTYSQQKYDSLFLLGSCQAKDCLQGLEDFSLTTDRMRILVFKVGHAVEGFLESFVVVFNTTQTLEEKLKVVFLKRDDLECRTKTQTLHEQL